MTSISIQALCLSCSRVCSAVYESRSDGVFLVRHCHDCGITEARISKDVQFFNNVLSVAQDAQPSSRGLIAELLDDCSMGCPTCIAESSPLAGNIRATALLKARILRAAATEPLKAILLSGGEPTEHPEFLDIVNFTSTLEIPARVLITNGLRFAEEDERFLQDYVAAGGRNLEVFLQWDSLRPEALRDIRGEDYSEQRRRALEHLAAYGITTTLVNVVKRGVTLEHIGEVLAVARENTNVVGVQFQPIRDAGRVLNYASEDNSCEVPDVFEQLPGKVQLAPCPSSPWSTFIGWMNRHSGAISTGKPEDTFYISPTNTTPEHLIRIAVLDYSDRFNWTNERSRLASLNILGEAGATPSVDDYFLNIA